MKRPYLLLSLLLPACSLLPSATRGAPPAVRGASPAASAPATAGAPPSSPASAAPGSTEKIPPLFVRLIELRTATPGNDQLRATLVQRFAAAADAFAPHWAALQQRRSELAGPLAEAAAAHEAGRHDEARAVLDKLITPPTLDSNGRISGQRDLIEVIDAELPAVTLLVEVARAQRDFVRVVEAGADLAVRRAVGTDATRELTLWMAATMRSTMMSLTGGDDDVLRDVLRDAHVATQAGAIAAGAHHARLAELGVKRTSLVSGDGVVAGDIVLFTWNDLLRAKRDGNKLSSKRVDRWDQPYACAVTTEIDHVDQVTGRVVYKEKCKYRASQRTYTVSATLTGELPAWAEDQVLGGVKQGAPNWVLEAVVVPDLRFREGLSPTEFQAPF